MREIDPLPLSDIIAALAGLGAFVGAIWMTIIAVRRHGPRGAFCLIPAVALVYGVHWFKDFTRTPTILIICAFAVYIAAKALGGQ